MYPRIVQNKSSVKETLARRSFSGPDPVGLHFLSSIARFISHLRLRILSSLVFGLLTGRQAERAVQPLNVRCYLDAAVGIFGVGDDEGFGPHAT